MTSHIIRTGIIGLLLVMFAACEVVPTEPQRTRPYPIAQPSGPPAIGPWGYPLDAIDPSVDPGDDFFAYANGAWLAETEIPSNRTGVGFAQTIRDRNQLRLSSIISGLEREGAATTPNEIRIRNLYQSYIGADQDQLPGEFLQDLDALKALNSHDDIAATMADVSMGLKGLFSFFVSVDPDHPGEHKVHVSHEGLTLPDRSYYLENREDIADVRSEFERFLAAVLTLARIDRTKERAEAVFRLENDIANLHWPSADRRRTDLIYNATTLSELAAEIPEFPWAVYAARRGYDPEGPVIVRENTAFPALARLFRDTPVEVWRDYLIAHYFVGHLGYLGDDISAPHFDLFAKSLGGQQTRRERQSRAIDFVNRELDQAIGEIYVKRFFTEESKRQMQEMFENIRLAMAIRIDRLDWMSEPTKIAAQRKLARMRAKIGYPTTWRDYGGLSIDAGNLIGNVKRIREFAHSVNLSRLADPVRTDEWARAPQTVNAFYSQQLNEVFLPAGYIQSPLFDPNADAAINYGAIGSIIGHEIAHGFDDQGSTFDADGSLSNWWRASDRRAFNRKTAALIEQYNQYEPLPGLFVNGRRTVGENLGDLAGTEIALLAYELALGGETPPVLDGFTGLQRFFLGRAQARRFKRTEESLRRRVLSRPHAPMRYRVNGVVRNMDAWYRAFDVKPEDDLYLPSRERVRIW